MLVFGNKYVKGITQFIPDNHFGPRDFIDYHREKMGLTREEYMAFYRKPVDYRLAESINEAKFPGRKGEFIKWKDEYYDIKKTSGSTAYVKFPHTASSAFSQVWDDEVTLADEKHRGKRVWLMESVVNEATVTLHDLDLNRFQKNKFKKHLDKHGVKLAHVKFNTN